LSLPENVVKNILGIKKKYFEYRSSREGEEFERERRKHEGEVKKILSREVLRNLDETSLLTLANNLYAFMWWTKKEWLVDYWIKGAGGIEKLRESLEKLLYSDRSLVDRFDSFRKNVKGVGVAMITEMLAYFNPKIYGIWNKKVKKALLKLGITQTGESFNINKISINKLTGEQYEAIIETLKEIAKLLRDDKYLPDPDLLDVDYFLFYFTEILTPEGDSEDEEYGHEDVVNMILEIGKGLGFDVLREVPLAIGTRVDAIWSARIGNLGELKYVFEVHIKGDINSLLVNLMKASQDPTVQKIVAVAVENELERIKREASTLRALSDKMLYWDIREVSKVHELIEELMSIMQRLGLTKI
jgi:hypothetical protein